jgi:Polyketide cyclase / dehydrase and lipid transport
MAMPKVVSTIRIRRDVADVFDFLTTPKNWPEWQPASISVAGATDHSLAIGEEVTEEFLAAGRRGSTVWRVTAREAPYLWRIESSEPEASATITYRLRTEAETTVFERAMQYRFDRAWLIVLDALFFRRRMEGKSREALFRAEQILEKS